MDVESRSEEIFFHIVCLLIGFDLFGRIHLRTMSVDPFLPANLSTDKTLSFKLKLYIFNSESIPHYGNRHWTTNVKGSNHWNTATPHARSQPTFQCLNKCPPAVATRIQNSFNQPKIENNHISECTFTFNMIYILMKIIASLSDVNPRATPPWSQPLLMAYSIAIGDPDQSIPRTLYKFILLFSSCWRVRLWLVLVCGQMPVLGSFDDKAISLEHVRVYKIMFNQCQSITASGIGRKNKLSSNYVSVCAVVQSAAMLVSSKVSPMTIVVAKLSTVAESTMQMNANEFCVANDERPTTWWSCTDNHF